MKCKKIIYYDLESNAFSPKILFGRLLEEDQFFIKFETGRGKTYTIHKKNIISIVDSNKTFISETGDLK